MKKSLVMILMVFTLFALSACGVNGTTPETGDSQYSGDIETDVPSDTPTDYYDEADVSTVLKSLAGVWDWPDTGRIIYIYADGIGYQTSGGDADFRGRIELTQNDDSYIVEFIALEAIGPGTIHDSYGNIRDDAINMIEAGEYDWLPVYGGPILIFSGIYNAYYGKFELIFGSPWNMRYELVRRNPSVESSESAAFPDTVGVRTPFTGAVDIIALEGNFDVTEFPDVLHFSRIEDSIWMMFRFEVPVRDVVFVSIIPHFDERLDIWLYELGETWFEAGDLEAGRPILIQTIGHFGTLPAQAIGFTYADGARYYIPFDESQMDGSLVLHKWSAFTFSR